MKGVKNGTLYLLVKIDHCGESAIILLYKANAMELLLERVWPKETYTVGKFYVEDKRFGESMEDKDRGLDQSMSEAQIAKLKKYGETAIPKGRYEVKMTFSPKFSSKAWAKPTGGKVPEICCVPGYEGVRIHPLNSAKDSLGCIGVGKNDKKGWISRSTEYYRNLVDNYIVPAINRGERIFITIK